MSRYRRSARINRLPDEGEASRLSSRSRARRRRKFAGSRGPILRDAAAGWAWARNVHCGSGGPVFLRGGSRRTSYIGPGLGVEIAGGGLAAGCFRSSF